MAMSPRGSRRVRLALHCAWSTIGRKLISISACPVGHGSALRSPRKFQECSTTCWGASSMCAPRFTPAVQARPHSATSAISRRQKFQLNDTMLELAATGAGPVRFFLSPGNANRNNRGSTACQMRPLSRPHTATDTEWSGVSGAAAFPVDWREDGRPARGLDAPAIFHRYMAAYARQGRHA